jgi:glycosyltransferase involved in cell wall biosynthesis
MEPIRIGIPITRGLASWAGGYNYVTNLLRVLRQVDQQSVDPVLFAGQDVGSTDIESLTKLVDAPIIIAPEFNSSAQTRETVRAVLFGSQNTAAKIFRGAGVDVVFEHAAFYGRDFPLPVLVWIPDFQHRHMPKMFSWVAYQRREFGIRMQLSGSRALMVSSESARQDCIDFYSVPKERISVVPFAVLPGGEEININPGTIREQYALPRTFFLVANQFWKHKNHIVICEALALMKERGEFACVAAPGRQDDYRDPSVFVNLMAYVKDHGIEDMFRPLGSLPYSHVMALLRASTALINPSLFEGWNTSVEEAKSFGVPTLVSDIPVHREQLGAGTAYFEAHSAHALADNLGPMSRRGLGTCFRDRESNAAASMKRRVLGFAASFRAVADKARQLGNIES